MTHNPDVDLQALTANWTPQAKERALQEWGMRSSVTRHYWYCDRGRTCDGHPHEGYEYKHARADQWPPLGNDWLVWAIFSGRGCVAPWTLVYDPVAGEHVPIADLAAGMHVDTFDGPVELELPAFRKGMEELWNVRTVDGCTVAVTAEHKFLTRAGWKKLLELDPSDVIAGGARRPNLMPERPHGVYPEGGAEALTGHNIYYQTKSARTGATVLEGDFVHPEWVSIDSIGFSHYGEYWDVTVPGAHHYAAQGLWHHNSGKTRTGAEWLRKVSERVERIGMVGRRGVDIRATMVEGDSGLITVCENAGIGYDWQPSKREFTFANGSKVFGYSGEEPASLRGPQHGALWFDEPAHMPLITDVWDNALLGLRLPGMPGGAKVLVTTTPLPTKWVKAIEADPATRVVRASTYANIDNLDFAFRKTVLERFEGTRRGRQELYGEVLADIEGALWQMEMFQSTLQEEDYDRIIVGVDPAGSVNVKSDETGLIVVGQLGKEYHVLADGTGKYSPNDWAMKAIALYDVYRADAIVAEKNFGGDMVRTTIENAAEQSRTWVRVIVATAARSKALRAEPVVGLYEQRRVKHVRGLEDLEAEMCEWVPGKGASPNRVDALVWAITELAGGHSGIGVIGVPQGEVNPNPGANTGRPSSRIRSPKDLIKGIFA